MPSTLRITRSLIGDSFQITATIDPGGALPQEIFLYENNGDGTLGEFVSVCSLEDLTRTKVFTANPVIPALGNRFVRHNQAKIEDIALTELGAIATDLIEDVQLLSTNYQANISSVTLHTIS